LKKALLDNFWAFIDSLGQLSDEDLYEDIDETMKRRKEKVEQEGEEK